MFSVNNNSLLTTINNLTRLGAELAISNERLVTGKKVNRASDNPSGIVAISNFDAEIARIDAITRNGTRIGSIIDTADGAMSEIATLVGEIDDAIVASAGDPGNEATYQATIDTAIDAINTLVNNTTFNGTRLLDGSIGYSVSGVQSNEIVRFQAHSANTAAGDVSLEITTVAAEKGEISYTGGALVNDVSFTLTGPSGSYDFSFLSGTSRNAVYNAINAQTGTTGIVATEAPLDLYLRTENYGSDQTVSITNLTGTFGTRGGLYSDSGVDAGVTVNGQYGSTSGQDVYYSNGTTSIEFTLADAFSGTTTVTISGDGAGWVLDNSSSGTIHFGQGSLHASVLGNDTLGRLNSLYSGGTNDLDSGNLVAADNIVELSKDQIAADRARIGAISSYTVDAYTNSLADTRTALTSAKSSIEDLDYAVETANNNRLQLLTQIGASILTTINQNTSSILSLLMAS